MPDELILTLDFETPPSAEDLGEVFSALASDYREMTNGRTLVVIRVDSGSIIATLTDAALAAAPYVATGVGGGLVVINAVNALTEFAKNLKEWFGYAKSGEEKKRLYRKGRKTPGQRSVEAIIKTASDTRSHIRVKYKSEKGETLEAELTPAEAISAREHLPAKDFKKVRRKPMQRILRSAPEFQMAVERFQQVDTQNMSPTEVHAIVDVIVAVLKAAGAGYLLSEIASELDVRGVHNIAFAVRQHIRPPSGTHEPPLTTT
jgi:hypothetical protein